MTRIEVSSELVERLIASPDLYPNRLVMLQDYLEFCTMSWASYRESPFLDHRMVCADQNVWRIPFDAIKQLSERLDSRRTHYIFHNAFACSTLLTRYLDRIEGFFTLREPNSLYEVATVRRFAGLPTALPLRGVEWSDLFIFVMRLLGRRYRPDVPVIIKPTDACNSLMAELVADHPGNRAIFIYSTLERFLASILRYPQRHEWVKIRVRELLMDDFKEKGVLLVPPETLGVEQAAALLWVLHTDRYITSYRKSESGAFRSINAEDFMADPIEAVWRIVQHFGMSLEPQDVKRSLSGVAMESHSKASNEVYNANKREQDYLNARDRFRVEIERAMLWIAQYSRGRELAAPLPGSLMADVGKNAGVVS